MGISIRPESQKKYEVELEFPEGGYYLKLHNIEWYSVQCSLLGVFVG